MRLVNSFPDEKDQYIYDRVLAVSPVPMKNFAPAATKSNPFPPPDMRPEMTDKQWLTKIARHAIIERAKAGNKKLAQEQAVFDPELEE